MRLELQDIVRRVGASTHLYPMSLAIEPAALTVLLGVTRAGKTSLMRVMAGLDAPSEGRVLVDGVDVTGRSVRERDVAMVYQQFINYPSMRVHDNIASPLRLRKGAGGRAWNRAQIDVRVKSIASRLHIDHLLDRLPSELSGGQQQRVALARALAKDAPLVLLDEPLANLDYKLREELREELLQIFSTGGSSVVYATTEPAEALLLGGHTAVLDKGRLLQYGPTIEVFERPATIEVAQAFSDPPINLIRARTQGAMLKLPAALDVPMHSALAASGTPMIVGIRASEFRLRQEPGDIAFDGRVELSEISGSDSFVHLKTTQGAIVAQMTGVHDFALGQELRVHADPGAFYVFDREGRLVLLPERIAAGAKT